MSTPTATTTVRPRRSVLYMPGANARALDKARSLDADALILDLEDSVAPDMKETARRQVVEAVAAGGYGRREIIIRVNALDGPWGRADLEAAASVKPHGVLIPKVGGPEPLSFARSILFSAGAAETALWAMIETPKGILNVEAIAASRHGLAALVIGTNDLAKETRARQVRGRQPMLAWLSQIVLAARAHGIDVIDGVFNGLDDEAGFRDECRQGLDMGMDGKTLIHPKQIAGANEIFAPTAEELAQAEKIIAAFAQPENQGKGVISLDGRMVERLHAEMAARVVALANAVAAHS
jgi:citrate lyase subunit beta/citryl-CoA lyase